MKAGRVTADGPSVGAEFKSQIADEKYECRYESVLEWGYWELIAVPPEAVVFGPQWTCSRVYISKSIHDFIHPADLVSCAPGLQVFQLELSHQG